MRAFYDFSVSPYSYDFLCFLIAAKAQGCDEIVFVPGPRVVNGVEFQKCNDDEREYRLQHLLAPLCEKAVICNTREEAAGLVEADSFPPGYTVENPLARHTPRAVLNLQRFDPPECNDLTDEARKEMGAGPVVIVIRETMKTERNSNIPEWIKAARWMRREGLNVWFVPDTAYPDRAFEEFPVSRRAALDVRYRIAVSQIAGLSLGVNGGPMSLCVYSRRPMLYFNPLTEGHRETSAEFWLEHVIPPGAQFPWFTELQRIVWEGRDDYHNIIRYVQKWFYWKERILKRVV